MLRSETSLDNNCSFCGRFHAFSLEPVNRQRPPFARCIWAFCRSSKLCRVSRQAQHPTTTVPETCLRQGPFREGTVSGKRGQPRLNVWREGLVRSKHSQTENWIDFVFTAFWFFDVFVVVVVVAFVVAVVFVFVFVVVVHVWISCICWLRVSTREGWPQRPLRS